MDVKELKEIIKDLPDDLPVGQEGHCNQYLKIDFARVIPVNVSYDDNTQMTILCIDL